MKRTKLAKKIEKKHETPRKTQIKIETKQSHIILVQCRIKFATLVAFRDAAISAQNMGNSSRKPIITHRRAISPICQGQRHSYVMPPRAIFWRLPRNAYSLNGSRRAGHETPIHSPASAKERPRARHEHAQAHPEKATRNVGKRTHSQVAANMPMRATGGQPERQEWPQARQGATSTPGFQIKHKLPSTTPLSIFHIFPSKLFGFCRPRQKLFFPTFF